MKNNRYILVLFLSIVVELSIGRYFPNGKIGYLLLKKFKKN